MQTRPPATVRSAAFWVLIAVFVLEFFLFDRFGARRHTPVYPRWNDQIQYLGESYTGYEYARAHGFLSGLAHTLTNPSAQGTLHDCFALIAFQLAGPSRSAALALNLLALVAWQGALFAAVARAGKSPALAFAAAMLPLALAGPWQNIPGSAYDFRLDHLAMCGLGACTAIALLTDGFRSRSWSAVFGVAVALTVLTRFLTGTYFVVLWAALLAWTLSGPERKARRLNLMVATAVAAVLAGPFLWLNRERVLDYYWIGHYIGPESAIRDPHLGVGASLRFVFGQLGRIHLGVFFGSVALLGVLALAHRARTRSPAAHQAWWLGAFFLLAPAVVLTLHRQKSEVVLSVLAPGVVLLVVAAWLTLAHGQPARQTRRAAMALAIVVGIFFTQRQIRPAYDPATLAHIRQVNTLADTLYTRIATGGIATPRVAVDYITDCLDAQVLRVICYERHHAWLPFDMTLPTGIAEPPEPEVRTRLERSDFVFLTEEAPPGAFPYDRKLETMRPELRAWCESHLRAAERFTLLGRRMVLYQRREIPFAAARP